MRSRRLSIVALIAAAITLAGSSIALAAKSAGPPAPPANTAVVAPSGTIAHAGRWMVDDKGRVVVIHGVNVPSNVQSYRPM